MSRWTRSGRGSRPDGDDRASNDRADDGTGSRSDATSTPPTSEVPAANRLREPRSADRFVRGRTRLTVRELMEQMNAADEGDDIAAAGAPDDSPTEAIPTTRSRIRRSRGGQPPTPAPTPIPARPPAQRPAPQADPLPDDQPTMSHRFEGNDVTQKIPPVTEGEPRVDLSDRATAQRAIEESRAQDSPTSQARPGGEQRDHPESLAEPASAAPQSPDAPASPAATTPAERNLAAADGESDASAGVSDADRWTPTPTPPQVVGSAAAMALPTPGSAPDSTAGSASAADSQTDDAAGLAGAAAAASVTPPLQRTPDLTKATRSRPRRVAARTRSQSLTRNATVTGRVLVSIACVLALVGTGFVWGYLKSWDGSWRNITAIDPDDTNIRNKNAQYGDENYLIVGTDTRSGKNSKVGAGTTLDAEGARSDTVILVNVPADRSRVVAVSFPRDLQVDQPSCKEWDNENGSYGAEMPAQTQVKLNSVYAFGGPQCLVSVITQMSGLNINHFIAMDFYGFEKVVNAVGGVEVCSTTPLYDYELGSILKKSGTQKLTGRRALNYVRARTVSTEGNGDYGRIKRQQLFMSSLLRSTLSGNVLSNPAKLNSIVNTFIQYSYVDGVDTKSLLSLAESMQGIEAGRVTFITLPTTGTATDGSNNELPNTEAIDAIFNAIIDDAPLPGEQARKENSSTSSKTSAAAGSSTAAAGPTRISATAQNPGNVGVRVLNGTGRTGAASDVSDQLFAQGFDVRGVADASENRTDTVIRYGVGEQDSAATLAEMFPGTSIQLDRTVRSGVEVILGSDFDGSVGSAPSVGSTLSVQQLPQATNSSDLPNDLAITNAGDTTCS